MYKFFEGLKEIYNNFTFGISQYSEPKCTFKRNCLCYPCLQYYTSPEYKIKLLEARIKRLEDNNANSKKK